MILPPYPFSLEDPDDIPLEDAWHARPQVFFKCWLRPKHGRPPARTNYTRDPDDIEAHLVFFSMFEELKLPARGPMDHATTNVSFQYEQTLRQIEAEQLKRIVAAQQAQVSDSGDSKKPQSRTVRNTAQMPGRNDPCPCGSGRKFKVCHLGKEQELLAILQQQPPANAATRANNVVRGKQRR